MGFLCLRPCTTASQRASRWDEAGFRNLRASEIKHGRAAMMAALGAVVQHYVKFPGFEGVPAGLDAVITAPGTYGALVMFPGSTFHCLDVISAFWWCSV